MKNILDCPDIIQSIADEFLKDIICYKGLPGNIIDHFLIPRQEDTEILSGMLEEIRSFGGNVLIVGDPGTGKTIFLNSFFKGTIFTKNHPQDFLDLIDLKPTPNDSHDPSLFKLYFIQRLCDAIYKILESLGDPCHEIERKSDTLNQYKSLIIKLQKKGDVSRNDDTVMHHLFIDDVDYIDNNAFTTILEYMRPLLYSRHCCVIIACRYPAYNTITNNTDTNISNAITDNFVHFLRPLPVEAILKARLKVLFEDIVSFSEAVNNKFISYFEKVRGCFQNNLPSIAEKNEKGDMGSAVDKIYFHYPFTEKQHNFMRNMNCGNIRQILLMSQELLKYMAINREILIKEIKGNRIGRNHAIQCFSSDTVDGKIRIVNIHEQKTNLPNTKEQLKKINKHHIGNSILVVVLEAVNSKQSLAEGSQYLYYMVNNYGLSHPNIEWALRKLISLSFIREKVLTARGPIGEARKEPLYELTSKGMYYLNYLIHWDEYIDKYGTSEHHEQCRTTKTITQIEYSLLEFSKNILLFRKQYSDIAPEVDFKVSKVEYLKKFKELYGDILLQMDQTDKLTFPPVDEIIISDYLNCNLNIIESHKLDKHRNFLFYWEKIKDAVEKKKMGYEIKYIYDHNDFAGFVDRHVRTPQYGDQDNV